MKLLWITSVYPSPNHPAEGVFHRTQSEALTSLGAEVKVIAPVAWIPGCVAKLNRRWHSYSDYPVRYDYNGVEVFRPRYFAHPRHFFFGIPHRLIAAAVRRLDPSQPDLIHAHLAFPSGLAARQISKRLGVPYVLTLHGSDVHTYPRINRQCRRRFLQAVEGARAVCAVGSALAQETERIAGIRPQVHPIGIDLQRFKTLPAQSEARWKLQLPIDKYVVLYVGRLVEPKGVTDLIEALRHKFSRPVTAIFVGDGPLLQKASGEPNVRVVGAVDNNQLPLYLAAADALVLPSRKEGLPTVLVEAGACGVPVLASRIDGVIELIGADRGHLVEPGSPQAIVDGIQYLISNSSYAAVMAGNLKRHVFESYDAKRNARGLMSFCERALSDDKSNNASASLLNAALI